MIILANKAQTPQQLVNTVGKYLYKNIDGAFKFDKSSNMCDVYFTLLYQIPADIRKFYGIDNAKYADVNEMTININVTTYQNKLRLNLIEEDPNELTLGSLVYNLEKDENLNNLRLKILTYLRKRLEKRYQGWEFIF